MSPVVAVLAFQIFWPILFGATAQELTNCSTPVDYCIAADSSNSITDDDFNTLVDILAVIVDEWNVGPTAQDSRVAMVKYGRDVFQEFNLTAYTDKATLVNVIRNVSRIEMTNRGGTNTPGAMEECVSMFEEQGREGVPRVIVVFTDGVTHYSGRSDTYDQRRLEEATAVTLAANTTNYGIAFGSRVGEIIDRATMELMTITGNNSDHFFIAKTLVDLANFTIRTDLTSIIGCFCTANETAYDVSDYRNRFCGCPVGETITSEPQFLRGICCPLIICEPIACTIGGVDYVEGETVPTIDPCEISCSCALNGSRNCSIMMCPSCPDGEKQTASVPPGPGVCCPTITCEPIACTIGGVDFVEGETVPTIDPCEVSCSCAANGRRNCSMTICPVCPDGEKQTASVPPGPGVCCPTVTCEPIACTIGGVDYVEGESVPAIDPCEISCFCASVGSRNCSLTTCPVCPAGQKQTASVLPGPGVCCPTITCEPIACTIGGVDYVEGDTVINTNLPCQPIPIIEQYITRDTAVLLKLNATSVVMNTITGGQVLVLPAEQAAGNRAQREALDFSSAAVVNVSLEGGRFLFVSGLLPGQDYSLKVATVNAAAVSRFTEWLNVTTTSAVAITPSGAGGALLLQWTPPTLFDGEPLLQYEVTLTPLGAGSAVQVRYTLPSTQSELTAQGLQEGVEYQVKIETRVDSGLVQPFYSMNVTIPSLMVSHGDLPTIGIASGCAAAGVLLLCLVVVLVAALICWRKRSGRYSLKLVGEGGFMVTNQTSVDAAFGDEMMVHYSGMGGEKTSQAATQEPTLQREFHDEHSEMAVTSNPAIKAFVLDGEGTADANPYEVPYAYLSDRRARMGGGSCQREGEKGDRDETGSSGEGEHTYMYI